MKRKNQTPGSSLPDEVRGFSDLHVTSVLELLRFRLQEHFKTLPENTRIQTRVELHKMDDGSEIVLAADEDGNFICGVLSRLHFDPVNNGAVAIVMQPYTGPYPIPQVENATMVTDNHKYN